MTELQIGLLAIGALVVGGVLIYNRVQERAARREAERAFSSGHADVLLEPVAVAPLATPRPLARPAALEPGAEPDPRLDYIIEITLKDAGSAQAMQDQWPAIERRHSHRALLAGSADGLTWRAARQLVSRDGAVSEAELIEFRSAVETLAAAAGASVSAPEMRSAVEAARELDEFCGDSDIQVVLHVEGGPFPGTKIRAAAEATGLALEADGRFALRNDAGLVLYTLGARDGTPFTITGMRDETPAALSLAMDLARAPDTARAFESLARLAHQLAATLGGSIVDDNGKPLDERTIGAIAQQLGAARARLEARGLAPGSPAAQRLFS
ncbi:MAG: cell division protein ZipA C-terminal FtsZ-binding domain-containing protein [Burkholderiales bacterium]